MIAFNDWIEGCKNGDRWYIIKDNNIEQFIAGSSRLAYDSNKKTFFINTYHGASSIEDIHTSKDDAVNKLIEKIRRENG